MLLVLGYLHAAELSGTVYAANGMPLSGVTVYAYDLRGRYTTATTRNGGVWNIRDLPAGSWRLRAYPEDTPEAPNNVERFYPQDWDFCGAERVNVGPGDIVTDLDLDLPDGGILRGKIQDENGAPLPGAYVVCGGDSARSEQTGGLGLTGEDGSFSVVGLDSEVGTSEPYWCAVYADGYADQYLGPSYQKDGATTFEVTIGEETEVGAWTLLPGIRVEGDVTGPNGPVAGGAVYVYASSQVLGVPTDSVGHYVADGLPPGDVVAWAQAAGLGTTYYPDADRPGTRVSVPDEGQVYSGLDLHMPAESALNLQLSGEGALDQISVLLYNSDFTVGRGDGVDATGRVRIGGLHPGDYSLQLYAADAGYVSGFALDQTGANLVIAVDGETALNLNLVPEVRFSGAITDENDLPIYGVQVVVRSVDDTVTQVTTTDTEGLWEIGGLPTGDYHLNVSYTALCPEDPGWVAQWWDGAYSDDESLVISAETGETVDHLDFHLPTDNDHDDMGDLWEADHGLDPHRNDADEDADGDGFTNLEEWRMGTDPNGGGALDSSCNCRDGGAWLLPLVGISGLLRRRSRVF